MTAPNMTPDHYISVHC